MTSSDPHEESLPLRGLHALAPWAWRGLVFGVVLLATYVAIGRFFLLQLGEFREPVLDQVNARLPFTVEAASLRGGWSAFSPEIEFSELRLIADGRDEASVALAGGSLRIDVPESLAGRTLQVSRLELSGLNLDALLTDDGRIEVRGFRSGAGLELGEWLETFLPNVQRVLLRDSRLTLETPAGLLALTLDVALDRRGNARQLQARLHGRELDVALRAEGVGNPLNPQSWTGDLFVDAGSPNLKAFDELWTLLNWPFSMEGDASVQFWLARAGGASSATVRVDAEDLRLEERSGAWALPIDALAFEAALSQRSRHWSLVTEDFHVEREGQVVDLDRAQFDWWGQALRMRMTDLELDDLPALLGAAPGVPESLRAALPDLAPRGHLDALELRLDDLSRPAESWHLRSALDGVAIGSWRNGPALEGVRGYLDLGPAGGSLLLDSDDLTTLYPKVYRQKQVYNDAVGELRLTWDRELLEVSSGLLRLRGDEGEARGLLGLTVPLQPSDIGIELELLIGLQDSDAAYRDRYLPYKLRPQLLAWLERSIVAADVNSAGFVWRGSTRPDQKLHRTLQLFLDVANAELEYDPPWPRLEDLAATLWIDDARTYAAASSATSAGAELSNLAVSVVPVGGPVRLTVSGEVAGDASSAQVLLADSPLATLTDGVFAEWSFAGPMVGDLTVAAELGGDGSAPFVDLHLGLDGVSTNVVQASLPISQLTGDLHYRSDRGFVGSRVAFNALGGSGDLEVLATPDRSLDLRITSEFDAGAVRTWLDLPFLAFADGRSTMSGNLLIDDAGSASLGLESDLLGVSLDAPQPFAQGPERALHLFVDLELQSDPQINLALGERLEAALEFRSASLHRMAARVGGGTPDLGACDQRYCLGGRISTLDISKWMGFQERYFGLDNLVKSDAGEPQTPDFTYRIDSLQVGELAIDDRPLGTARLDLWGVNQLWQGAVEAPWVQGSLTREGGSLDLLIERLDLDSFGGDDPVALEEFIDLLPSMRVDVLDLYSGERRLGAVGFDLESRPDEGALYAANVRGQLWEARLDDPYPGLLRWSTTGTGEQTEIEFDPGFDDFGSVIAAAGYAPSLESERGRASVRLRWPGPPSEFAATLAMGSIDLSARSGRVLESRPGPLALIGFLNFAEILRGLSMTYVFESGIPFETADAELYLHGGTVEVIDLQIDGAASAFAFTGVSDLELGEVDGELVVTLPVANNLPWVAALAGGIPVAAGVFVVSKVFEKQVNRMSSAVYGVSGDIEAPEVEFRRLFDDQLTPTPPVPEGSGTGDD